MLFAATPFFRETPTSRAGRARRARNSMLLVAVLALGSLAVSVSELRPVAAAADPVIAAAGDIACDPLDSRFNSGNGVVNYCQQKATSRPGDPWQVLAVNLLTATNALV